MAGGTQRKQVHPDNLKIRRSFRDYLLFSSMGNILMQRIQVTLNDGFVENFSLQISKVRRNNPFLYFLFFFFCQRASDHATIFALGDGFSISFPLRAAFQLDGNGGWPRVASFPPRSWIFILPVSISILANVGLVSRTVHIILQNPPTATHTIIARLIYLISPQRIKIYQLVPRASFVL